MVNFNLPFLISGLIKLPVGVFDFIIYIMYSTKQITRIIDSAKVITPFSIIKISIVADVIKTIKSIRKNVSFILIFLAKIADKPSISKTFVMLDPTTFPATISELFCITAIIEEINSGRLVPIATIVTPTINGDSFK